MTKFCNYYDLPRMESFMAEFCERKSYPKTSKGLQFGKKRKLFDDFVRFKTEANKPKLPSGLSFEVIPAKVGHCSNLLSD